MAAQKESGRVLVVDDQGTSRLKMTLAVKALGHVAEAADQGTAALELLQTQPFDLVLLDIVMPQMDGFEVLARMKADKHLRDIPVIVISSLDDDMASVVRAIELGAEDFLPKAFDPVLLRARVNACLEKKRLRDLEVEYLQQVERLTDAAAILEAGSCNPGRLGLQEVAARDDALGRLARVFVGMAEQVYQRELRLRQNIRTLKGSLVLLAVGALWGLIAPLARMVAIEDAHPFGLALWTNGLGAVVCLGLALARGRLPHFSLALARYLLAWALLGGVIGHTLIYWVAEKLPASLISIVIVLEGFMVFAFAALMRIEQPNAKRLVGLGLGLCAILLIIIPGGNGDHLANWGWLLVAMAIPLVYAIEDIMFASDVLDGVDRVAAMGLMMALATLLLLPIVVLSGDYLPLGLAPGGLELAVLLIAGANVLGGVLFLYLVATTGSVFASQNAYAITLSGIAWSMLLLGEHLSAWTWLSLGLMVVGLILVEPKHQAEGSDPLPAVKAGKAGLSKPRESSR